MLHLKQIDAYTVNSSDDEYRSSDKGIYRHRSIAAERAPNSGWYGSHGTVKVKDDVYIDDQGVIYEVKRIGMFTDEAEEARVAMLNNITAKLTPDELKFIEENKGIPKV